MGLTNNTMVTQNRNILKAIKTLTFVTALSILPFALQAQLNPLSWFSKNNSDQVYHLSETNDQSLNKFILKAEKYEAKKNEIRAQNVYKKLLKKYPKSKEASTVVLKRGLYLQGKKNYEAAFSTYSILVEYHPGSQDLNEVIEKQFECAVALMNHTSSKGLRLIKPDPLNTNAIPLFWDFTRFYPFNEKTPIAYLHIAQIARAANDHDSAIEALEKLITDFSSNPLAEDAYFAMAHIYSEFIKGAEYDLESTREAIRYCEDFMALFPRSERIGTIEALYKRMLNTLAQNRLHLADYYYFNKRDTVAALIFYNEVISIAPNSDASIDAKKRIQAIDKGLKPTTGTNLIKRLLFIR